jgi:hypothetical protein
MAKEPSFGAAFAAARKEKGAGKTFTYKGKSYSTNTADDKVKAAPKAKPKANPKTVVNVAKAGLAKADAAKKAEARKNMPATAAAKPGPKVGKLVGGDVGKKPTGPQRPPRADAPATPKKKTIREASLAASAASRAKSPLGKLMAKLSGSAKTKTDRRGRPVK